MLKKVLEIVTLVALETVAGKVSSDRAGRAVHAMVPTVCRSENDSVESRVKLFMVKEPVIVPIEILDKLVSPPAFSQIKSPLIC